MCSQARPDKLVDATVCATVILLSGLLYAVKNGFSQVIEGLQSIQEQPRRDRQPYLHILKTRVITLITHHPLSAEAVRCILDQTRDKREIV